MPCRSLVREGPVDDLWRLAFRRGGDTACPPQRDRRGISLSLQSNGLIEGQASRDHLLVSRAEEMWPGRLERKSK